MEISVIVFIGRNDFYLVWYFICLANVCLRSSMKQRILAICSICLEGGFVVHDNLRCAK